MNICQLNSNELLIDVDLFNQKIQDIVWVRDVNISFIGTWFKEHKQELMLMLTSNHVTLTMCHSNVIYQMIATSGGYILISLKVEYHFQPLKSNLLLLTSTHNYQSYLSPLDLDYILCCMQKRKEHKIKPSGSPFIMNARNVTGDSLECSQQFVFGNYLHIY